MRPKSALKKLTPLLHAQSFTSEEARLRGVSASTLAYYVKQHEIIRLGHGIYRGANAPTIDDFRWDDLIEAMYTVKNGIICLTSALFLYHLTEEMPSQHWIAIKNETLHRTTKPTTKIIRMRNFTLGRSTIKISGITLPIFNRERTIIDAFRYLSRETALKALKVALTKKGTEKIDLAKLREYAKKLRAPIEPFLIAMTL